MATALPHFTPVEQSLYLTLCGRALDSRSRQPFLSDTASHEIASKIGYDLDRFPMAGSKTFDIALRAKRLDEVVRRFTQRQPDGVVVELGAGLDPRMARVNPPSTVDWYDVDFPEVIKVRQEVVPLRTNAHGIAADVTDPYWLDQLPRDRPAVIVADGLVAFLAEQDFTALLNRLTSHFPSGEIAFNGYTKFHLWAIKHYHGTDSIADIVRHPGFDDPHDPERWDPGLKLVEEIFLTRAPEVTQLRPAMRIINRLAGRSVAWSRRGTTVLRYQF
jgi:O-methyltransferase involved in polyketide biosynthesis